MAHFADLTPYTYFHPEQDAPGTVNVGWLDRWHPFPTGETSEAFRAKLRRLCDYRVKRTRGRYYCDFCNGREKPGSSAEIRVPGRGRVYAAPELVYHYVAVHRYLPPEEFISAVLEGEEVGEAERPRSGGAADRNPGCGGLTVADLSTRCVAEWWRPRHRLGVLTRTLRRPGRGGRGVGVERRPAVLDRFNRVVAEVVRGLETGALTLETARQLAEEDGFADSLLISTSPDEMIQQLDAAFRAGENVWIDCSPDDGGLIYVRLACDPSHPRIP